MASNMLTVVQKFDEYLTNKNLTFNSIIIGGAALNILKITSRFTKDVDCLDPKIPQPIKNASIEFSKVFPELGLFENWLNNGPDSLVRDLPAGWESRLQQGYLGKSVQLQVLGRIDLIKTKLFAFCDRMDPDYQDLLQLKPTREELSDSIDWVQDRDANPNWVEHVQKRFIMLRDELYG